MKGTYLLGMPLKVTLLIIMGDCTFLTIVVSIKFIKEQAIDIRAFMKIGGVIGVRPNKEKYKTKMTISYIRDGHFCRL